MKNIIIALLLFSGASFFCACNGNDTSSANLTTDTTLNSAGDTLGNKMDTTHNTSGNLMIDQQTKDFTADAATGGMMEVESGKIAEQNAQSKSVKDFGEMMVEDHTKVNDNLKNIASQKNIDLPASVTDNQRKDIYKLSKKTGSNFDKAYVDMMVEDHKKDIEAFKKAEGNISDNDIKNFILNTLPILQKHLDSIQAIKSKM
jgi:putative membrane protein